MFSFIKEIQDKKGFSQQLLFPELLQLMPDDYLFFEQIKAELRYVGFDFEADKAYQYQIKGIPVQLKTSSEILPLLSDMLERVKSSTGDALSVIHEHIALSLAETAAIQSGQTMSKEEMTDLVDQLFACPSHHHTPDGRLIMSIWTQEEIQNRFN